MYRIKVYGEFSAAHRIDGYAGDCSQLHGHNWRVCIAISTEGLDELGLSCDFREAKAILHGVLKELDHRLLNDHPWLEGGNPSSERLAKTIFTKLKESLSPRMKLDSVEVFESERSSVEYFEE